MKVIIIAAVFVLTFATDMTADETTIGRWCDRMVPNMPKHNQPMAIVITDGGKVMLKSSFGDFSQKSFYLFVTFERMARDARVQSIGGGATEIMLEEVAKRI